MAYVALTEDEWYERYKPKDRGYETYGADLNYIQSLPVEVVWTMLDGDDGQVLIVNGISFVNRISYYVTEQPHDPDDTIVVAFEEID